MESSFFSRSSFITSVLAVLIGCSACAHHRSETRTPAGTNSSGGGEGVLLNDTVVVARPVVQEHGGVVSFGPELSNELDRAGKLLVRYGAAFKPSYDLLGKEYPYSLDRSAFISDYVIPRGKINAKGSLIEYRFVSELPTYPECTNRTRAQSPVHAGEVVRLACTMKYITWIREDLFNKMTVREQAKLIIHERLHSYGNPGVNEELFHEFIDDITEGLDLALGLYNSQIHGERPVLTDDQVDLLIRMMRRIAQIELNRGRLDGNDMPNISAADKFLDLFTVTPNGGGLVTFLTSKTAYIGAGSVAWSRFADGSELIDTSCYDPRIVQHIICELGVGAKMHFVTLYGHQPDKNLSVTLADGAQMINVSAQMMTKHDTGWSRVIKLGKNAKLLNVDLKDIWGLTLGDQADVTNINFNFGYGTDSVLTAVTTRVPHEKLSEFPAIEISPNVRVSYKKPSADYSLRPFDRRTIVLVGAKTMGISKPVLRIKGSVDLPEHVCSSNSGNHLLVSGKTTMSDLADLERICLNR